MNMIVIHGVGSIIRYCGMYRYICVVPAVVLSDGVKYFGRDYTIFTGKRQFLFFPKMFLRQDYTTFVSEYEKMEKINNTLLRQFSFRDNKQPHETDCPLKKLVSIAV